jgi:hypothetical protein
VDFWEASMVAMDHSTPWKNTNGITNMLKSLFPAEFSVEQESLLAA